MKFWLFYVFLYLSIFCHSQETKSLFQKLKTAQSDTQKVSTLNTLTKLYFDINLDSAALLNKQALAIVSNKKNEKYSYKSIYYKALVFRKRKNYDSALVIIEQAQSVAKKYNNQSEQANALHFIGQIYDQLNRNDLAAEYFLKALNLGKTINDKKEILSANLSLGIYYKKISKTTQSLDYLLAAMKTATELNDSGSVFTTAINLGTMYERTNDNEKALDCYRKALIMNQYDKDENDRAICFYKLGKYFHRLKQIDSAKFYLLETQKIHEKRNDQTGLIFDYANMAGFNLEENDFVSAEKNYFKALELGLKDGDTNKLNLLYSYLGTLYQRQNKYDLSIKYFKISLSYVNQTVPRETVMQIHHKMSEMYSSQGKYKDAYQSYIKYKAWSDSAFNVNEARKQTELKLNYEFEQTQKKIEEETKAKEILAQAELDKERMQRNYLLAGFLVISVLLAFAIKNYKAKQKANDILHQQKQEIEEQKKIVEEKNNEINDSINYAKRIQTATIPKANELDLCFNEYDILFKPKDVVSGDFYWADKIDNYSLVAVADCTGHGVPGAITSTIGSILLNEIFHVKRIYQPDLVLQELNRLVKLTLRQEENSLTNDGMDIAFCMWNKQTNELHYSGANRPLYILSVSEGVKEFKPTKVSIGGQVPLMQNYQFNTIQLKKGDTIILTTDGYADQFGGHREKKLTTKVFKSILSECVDLSPKDIKLKLEHLHQDWKGKHEQTDDVLVFIFKV
jgi:serine phosphatase RsbU (regulator of sigma subunit)